MAAYDEALAHQILQALQEVFPNKVSSDDLKARPAFANVPDEKWLLALEALFRLGLIDGKALRAGDNSTLQAAANLEITPSGRERLRSQYSDGKWISYYLSFFEQFGLKFYQRWKGKIVAAVVGAVVGFLIHRSPEAWTNQKSALQGILLGVGIFAIGDLCQTPWLIHKKVIKQEQAPANKWSAAFGIGVFVLLLSGLLYLTSSHWLVEKPVEKIVEKPVPQESPVNNVAPSKEKLKNVPTTTLIPPGTRIEATTNAPDSAAVGINTGTVTVNPPVNPYTPVHTFDFNGARRISEPGKQMVEVGEETNVFQKIVQLQTARDWNGLRDVCEEQIKKTPEWLTPYLFAGVAYANLRETAKATERLTYVKKKAGGNPAYADADRLLNMLQPK